jgi:hypothetical protein
MILLCFEDQSEQAQQNRVRDFETSTAFTMKLFKHKMKVHCKTRLLSHNHRTAFTTFSLQNYYVHEIRRNLIRFALKFQLTFERGFD